MRKNNFDSACSVCGEHVPAGKGALSGPPWKVKCMPCSGEVDTPIFVKVTRLPDGEILFEPSGYLGDKFSPYVTALQSGGARYDGKNNRAKIDKALDCIAALEKTGFLLKVHPDVSATLQAFAQVHKTAVAEAGARANKVDEALRARGLALYPFQRIGVEWLAGRMRALLADDMGLGKTIQALTAIPEGAPVLVIGPQSAMGVWAEETPKWRPDLTFSAIERKDFHWPAKGEMLFCTYGSMPDLPDFDGFGQMADGTVLISDEAHKVKDPKAKRTKRFREISARARRAGGRVWLLTGSPLLNDPREVWAILQAAELGHEAFGGFWRFCNAFNAATDQWGQLSFGTATPEAATALRKVMLRRKKAEVLTDLPEKAHRTIHVSIGAEWQAELDKHAEQLKIHVPSVYDWLRAGMAAYEEGAPKPGATRPDPVVPDTDIQAAREALLNDRFPGFEGMSHLREALAKAKIPALLNIVEDFEEQNEPLLVFSAHRAPIDTLAQRDGWAAITGDIDGEDRQRIARDFQDGKYKGLALTIEAGGTALTLTRASQEVFVDRTFTPLLNTQAEDRAARIGQTRGVVVTTLIADHYLDRRLAEILDHKERIIKSSVEAAAVPADYKPELPVGVADVDFDKLNAVTQASLQGLDEARAEAERLAAERAKNAEELRAKLLKEAEERKAKAKAEKRYQKARARAVTRGWVEAADHPERRAAQSEGEKWAEEGLAKLSGLDPDRARDRNDVGFSKSDSYLGHWLTVEIKLGGLTPNQWRLAIGLCRPYWRQIGHCPEKAPEPPKASESSV
jgi:SWI/SNF-related matrix-associated actin-dependent regulator 1 of chromatin subfamily A